MRARALLGVLREDRGSMTILVTGFLVVILMVTALGASITAVHLDRNALQSTADTTALAASQAIGAPVFYGRSERAVGRRAARAAAQEHLARYAEERGTMSDISLADVRVADDGTVSVVLTARSHPPLVSWFTRRTGWSVHLDATGESRAQ